MEKKADFKRPIKPPAARTEPGCVRDSLVPLSVCVLTVTRLFALLQAEPLVWRTISLTASIHPSRASSHLSVGQMPVSCHGASLSSAPYNIPILYSGVALVQSLDGRTCFFFGPMSHKDLTQNQLLVCVWLVLLSLIKHD